MNQNELAHHKLKLLAKGSKQSKKEAGEINLDVAPKPKVIRNDALARHNLKYRTKPDYEARKV